MPIASCGIQCCQRVDHYVRRNVAKIPYVSGGNFLQRKKSSFSEIGLSCIGTGLYNPTKQ